MHQLSSTVKTKLPGWQGRLLTTIEELKEVPFVWGQNDCCVFAAKCIDAQYGTEIAPSIIGEYDTELGAKRFTIKRAKSSSITALIDTYLTERVDIKFAQRGDVVTFNGALGLTAGILWTGCIWAMGPNGVETIPLNKVTITDVWRA